MLLISPKLPLEVSLSFILSYMLCKSSMQKYMLAQIPKHLLNTYCVYKPHYRHIDLISACVSWSTLSTTLGLVRGTLLYFYTVLH